jgi:small-conductance mechanosensitive channel
MAFGAVYVLVVLVPLPPAFVPLGKRIILGGVTVVALVSATRVLLRVLEWLGARYGLPKLLAQGGHAPTRATVFVALLSLLANHVLALPDETRAMLRPLLRAAFMDVFAWLLVRGGRLAAQGLWHAYRARVRDLDPARVRSMETLLTIAQYVTSVVVILLATAAALRQFTVFQTLATSLLASAGIAGVVLGVAAQRSLGNVFAGLQLALTQPVRLGDQVVFEGEWGTVEDITLGCKSPHKHLRVKQLSEGWRLDELVSLLPPLIPLSVRHPLGRFGS